MYIGIILTMITGLFFLIGIYSLNKVKDKEKTTLFTISMASVVMFGLLAFHLLPELIGTKNLWLIIPAVIGFMLLILLDKFIPHHNHEHTDLSCDKHEHKLHLNHIGIITIIALAIHNLIEGLTLYSVTLNSVKSGVLMMLGIALHNVPLGFQIGNSLKFTNHSKVLILLLCFSSALGGFIYMLFGAVNESIISILLALTFGMLVYILVFELFNEIRRYLYKKFGRLMKLWDAHIYVL